MNNLGISISGEGEVQSEANELDGDDAGSVCSESTDLGSFDGEEPSGQIGDNNVGNSDPLKTNSDENLTSRRSNNLFWAVLKRDTKAANDLLTQY